MPTNEELIAQIILLQKELVVVASKLERSTEERFRSLDVELTWYKMILFKIVVPLVVAMLLLLSIKESNVGMIIAKYVTP